MDGKRGAGGKTPRGRKPRGNRGRGQDSSPRTPTTPSPSSSLTAAVSQSQSPENSPAQLPSSPVAVSLTSETSSSALSTPSSRGLGRDVQSTPKGKVESPKNTESNPKELAIAKSALPSTSKMSSETPTFEGVTEETKETIESDTLNENEQSQEHKEEKEESDKEKERLGDDGSSPACLAVTPQSTTSSAEYQTPSRDLDPPELPPSVSKGFQSASSSSTKSKVSDALSQKPKQTAKTLVVNPENIERSTDNPLVVDIDPQIFYSPIGGSDPNTRASSSASQTRPRSRGSASPAYAYSLRGPLGKPGYIGGVGFSDGEDCEGGGTPASGKNIALQRRESAIAAVETAVKGFTKRQWILLFLFGLVDLLAAVTISLQAPFFPQEAERKGATATEYGFVFGIFEFVVFLMSPVFGKYMNKLGPKTVFSVCIFISSVAVICFGLLDRVNDHTLFISLCFVCRIFEALGCAGFFTATFVIIACEFPESVATTFASLETFFGFGMILGPTMGGALYGIGGFSLPFFIIGGGLLLTAVLSSLVMPKIDKATDDDGTVQAGYGVWTILKFPSVLLAAFSIASTSMSLGFVSAILEPHIRSFGLTPLQTGLVFIINGSIYALSAPIIGYLCDFIRRPIYITIIGNCLIFSSFLLVGPAAFMPFDTILWVTIIGLIIQGFGFGCGLVSGFIIGLRDSMKHGLPDNMATYGVASGLWTSCISFGACIGPSSAGVLYEHFGFRSASYLVLITALIAGIANVTYTCCTTGNITPETDSESQALLRPISPLMKKKEIEETTPTNQSTSKYGSTNEGAAQV